MFALASCIFTRIDAYMAERDLTLKSLDAQEEHLRCSAYSQDLPARFCQEMNWLICKKV